MAAAIAVLILKGVPCLALTATPPYGVIMLADWGCSSFRRGYLQEVKTNLFEELLLVHRLG